MWHEIGGRQEIATKIYLKNLRRKPHLVLRIILKCAFKKIVKTFHCMCGPIKGAMNKTTRTETKLGFYNTLSFGNL
jgi:hypothetical protein